MCGRIIFIEHCKLWIGPPRGVTTVTPDDDDDGDDDDDDEEERCVGG